MFIHCLEQRIVLSGSISILSALWTIKENHFDYSWAVTPHLKTVFMNKRIVFSRFIPNIVHGQENHFKWAPRSNPTFSFLWTRESTHSIICLWTRDSSPVNPFKPLFMNRRIVLSRFRQNLSCFSLIHVCSFSASSFQPFFMNKRNVLSRCSSGSLHTFSMIDCFSFS